jgi:hypothetical protein
MIGFKPGEPSPILSGGAPQTPDGRRFAEIAVVGSIESLAVIKVCGREKPVILRERIYSFLPDG